MDASALENYCSSESKGGVDVLEELLESLGAAPNTNRRNNSSAEIEEEPVAEENLVSLAQEEAETSCQPLFGHQHINQASQNTKESSETQSIRLSNVGNISQDQAVYLVQGSHGQLETSSSGSGVDVQSQPRAQAHSLPTHTQQQIVIPIDISQPQQQMRSGNTVLLPIIPTLMPDGKIEIRVAGNAIPLSSAAAQLHQQATFSQSATTSTVTAPGLLQKALASDAVETKVVIIGAQRDEHRISSKQSYGVEEEEGNGMRMDGEIEERSENPEEVDQSLGTVKGRSGKKAEAGKMFSCNLCDYSNPRRYLLSRHMKSHSEDRPHVCSVCERRFKTASSLQNHINTHSGVKPFECRMCEMAFTTSGELVRHVRYKHTLEKPHRCLECDYATVELSKLKRHMRSHTGERPYKCQYCDYSSPDTYKLKRHVRVHTGEKPYECDVCLARFTQSNSLKTHRLTHNPDEKPVFKCDYCPATCGRKTDLRIHVQKLHQSARPVRCAKCGKSFPDRYSFKVHYKTHDGQKCFACPHCTYAAFSQRHLEQHIMVHSDHKPFECNEAPCGKRFRQLAQLRRHHNLCHNPNYVKAATEKAHKCQHCSRGFRHKGNLKRHLNKHLDGASGELEDANSGDDEEEQSFPGARLIVAHKTEDASDDSASKVVVEPFEFEPEKPVKIFRFSTTDVGRKKLLKVKKLARENQRKRHVARPKPEELGLTNIKKRGRPRKIRFGGAGSGSEPLDPADMHEAAAVAKILDREKELNQSFGFSEIAESVEERIYRNTAEQLEEEVLETVIVDGGGDTDETLVVKDAIGLPVATNCEVSLNKCSLDQMNPTRDTMFDLDPEECIEIRNIQNS